MKKHKPEDFWVYVDKLGSDDCWIWKGNKGNDGYGRFSVRGHVQAAHRYSWYLTTGQGPEYLLHKCHNKLCVNPNHLYEGTLADNRHDMSDPIARHKRFLRGTQ